MDLIQKIMNRVGVDETQAKGGAGILFKIAEERMGSADFSRIAEVVPNMGDIMNSVPAPSRVAGMLGGMAESFGGGSLGKFAELAGSLSKLKLDKTTLEKFVPVILDYLKQNGLGDLVDQIRAAIPELT